MNPHLSYAIELAKNNPIEKLPALAAVLVLKEGGYVTGYNRLKTHPLQARFSSRPGAIYLHAEVDAIVNALRYHTLSDLDGSALYVARVLKNGQPALAKPCAGCQRAIVHFGIQHVEWTQ